MEAAWSLEILE